VLARLEVPRVSFTVMVREGRDARTLRRALGHMPLTALPGTAGNFVVTGHRDTFFRHSPGVMKSARSHVIGLRAKCGFTRRRPRSEANERPECTLITCFPD
jgi:sortase A